MAKAFATSKIILLWSDLTGSPWFFTGAGEGYPARPSAATYPPGCVEYVGPVQPTDWLPGDQWTDNS